MFGAVFGTNSEWFWAMLQFLAVAVSLWFIYWQIRLQAQANMLQALEALADKWNSEFLLECRHEACPDHPKSSLKIGNAEGTVLGFFEDLGLYYKRGVFDIEIVWERYSYFIEHYWSMYQPSITEFRADSKDASWFSSFEELFRAVDRFSKKKGATTGLKTKEQIAKFVRGELEEMPHRQKSSSGPKKKK